MRFFTNSLNIILCLIMFSFFYYVTRYTPFHSDDFAYTLVGLDFETHLKHYLNWSGRFIADYISPLLLLPKSHIFAAIIRSSVALFTVILIFKIAFNHLSENKISKTFFAIIIFSLFFNYYPTLGNGILWIVGSSNYLFTSFFAILFLFQLLRLNKHSNWFSIILCIITAFPAGLSSEFMALFLSMFFGIYFFTTKKIEKRKLLFIGISLAVGAMILVFAPGNNVRLHSGSFEQYLNRSFFEKIYFFVQFGLKWSLSQLKIPMILGIILIFANLIFCHKLDKRAIVFYILGVINVLLFFLSPYISQRALIIPFIIFLLSIACSFSSLEKILFCDKFKFDKLNIILLAFCIVEFSFFLVHYVSIATSVKATYYQQSYREKLIKDNLNQPLVEIPNFYWIDEYKFGDQIDYYFNPVSMGIYFGSKSKIEEKNISFDYSALISGDKSHAESTDSVNADIYTKRYKVINKSTFVIELDTSNYSKALNKLVLIDEIGNSETLYLTNENSYENNLNNKIYYGITKKFLIKNVKIVIFNDREFVLSNQLRL